MKTKETHWKWIPFFHWVANRLEGICWHSFFCHSVWFFPIHSSTHTPLRILCKKDYSCHLCVRQVSILPFHRPTQIGNQPQLHILSFANHRKRCCNFPALIHLKDPSTTTSATNMHISPRFCSQDVAPWIRCNVQDVPTKTQTWLPHKPQLRAQGMENHMIMLKLHWSSQNFFGVFFVILLKYVPWLVPTNFPTSFQWFFAILPSKKWRMLSGRYLDISANILSTLILPQKKFWQLVEHIILTFFLTFVTLLLTISWHLFGKCFDISVDLFHIHHPWLKLHFGVSI